MSVRRVVGRLADGQLQLTDVVGDLLAVHPDTAVVESRDGPVEVPVPLVVAARVVEPATVDILALEEVAARGWRAADTASIGGWLLRADAGLTWRANSVLPLRAPGVPVAEALDLAAAWYAERGLPLRLQLPLQARSLLDGELGELGFDAVQPDVHVLAARLDMLDRVAGGAPVALAGEPDDGWLRMWRPHPAARGLLTRHDRVGFASISQDGRTVAIARAAVDDGWLGVFCLEVAESHRRRGLARALMSGLHAWGREQGAQRCYVQVFGGNDAGLALFSDLGYWHHHDYRYRYRRDPSERPPAG